MVMAILRRNVGEKRSVTLDRVEFTGYGLDVPGHTDLRGKNVDGVAIYMQIMNSMRARTRGRDMGTAGYLSKVLPLIRTPLTGIWGQFPQYRGREGAVDTLEDRINGCMERSMNGRVLPLDGLEMKAFLAYSKWLSTGIPDGARLVGAGSINIKEPDRAADIGNGAKVFADTCAVCHGNDGLGQRAATGSGYQFPPIAGPDSYNNGAGMTRVLTAAAFMRHNMPLGTTFEAPVLSDADAYDVAAYVNSLDRPRRANLESDFPNKMQKPVDAPYGPYVDDFPAEQHKYGPFGPIRAKLRELAAAKK